MSSDSARDRIKRAIETRAFVRSADATIVRADKSISTDGWLMDLRAILMDSETLSDLASLFWGTFRDTGPVQIGGMETAGIPLITGIIAHATAYTGRSHTSGFYIRKSRKKDGLTKMFEGTLLPNVPIVLVDDLLNSGKSLIRQVEVLSDMGRSVHAVWTVLRFRDVEFYTYFTERNIAIHSVFTLNDFNSSLGIENKTITNEERYEPWHVVWRYSSPSPSYHLVNPKSDPAIDAARVYVGSDRGVFRALNQTDGSVAWEFKAGRHAKGKGIFSSPTVHDGVVYFGAYDGNVYALDAATGRARWTNWDADWVGSSPALAPDLGLLFIGLEFGLWRKRGGIAALDLTSGKTVWEYRMPCYTHSSPLYIPQHRRVVIGNNDGAVYCFDAQTGTLAWKYEKGPLTERELETGFGDREVKESFAYDTKRNLIIFGAMDGSLSALDLASGALVRSFSAEFGIYSTPLIVGDTVVFSSLDKYLYCLELDTFAMRWSWYAGARIFASPCLINGMIYIGANTGQLTEIDPQTGRARTYFTVSERITNRVISNPTTGHLFVPTFANEIYCLKRP